jgi:hypothetical protein
MIESRIKSSHTYNEETADEIVAKVTQVYFDLFMAFKQKIETLL